MPEWGQKTQLWTKQDAAAGSDTRKPEAWWANIFWGFQRIDYKEVELLVKHADGRALSKNYIATQLVVSTGPPLTKLLWCADYSWAKPDGSDPETIELELMPDKSWPWYEPESYRGVRIPPLPERRICRAENSLDAIRMGLHRTKVVIVQIYLSLRSLVSGRVDAPDNTIGPLRIAAIAFSIAGEDLPDFMVFLGFISINLAVINFLPIPVLDGGHMVFLIYEKVRGKPASEHVRVIATYAGLALILSLMLFATVLDVRWLFFK